MAPSDTETVGANTQLGTETETAISGASSDLADARSGTGGAGVPVARTIPATDHVAIAASHNAISGWFNAQLAALKHGAASVYHELVSIEADVTQWKDENPQIGALIDEGLGVADGFLGRFAASVGLPLPALSLVGQDMIAALKAMAASDPTVQSGSSSPVKPIAGSTSGEAQS